MRIGLIAVLLGVCAHGPPKDAERSLQVGDLARRYLLHAPTGRSGKLPLVLVFHGGGGHARNMPEFTGFDALADAEGFLVAYPDSLNGHWNDTRGLSPADDVAFVRALIDEISRAFPVDERRIFATGISNGGFFSQRLACDLADRIAAVASVAATMPETLVPVCKPSRPISVMFVQGTDDPLVHIEGGVIGRGNGRNVSLAAAARFWRDHDRTAGVTASDVAAVHRETSAGSDAEVVVYTIRGGGHTWPGGPQYLPKFLVGSVNRDIDATAEIWSFFRRQALP